MCCGSVVLGVCVLVLACRHLWLLRRRRLHRKQKLRQHSKQCNDIDAGSCHFTVCNQRLTVAQPSESAQIEITADCVSPQSNCPVPSRHNVCHCLPRGLRRKAPSTAVIRRGRSIESLLPGRPFGAPADVPRLTHSASVAILHRPNCTGSRSDLVQISRSVDDSISGVERWKPITVAGETTFPVQPSAAIFLSFDVDNPVRYKPLELQET